jgi:uncharacterized membrane protein
MAALAAVVGLIDVLSEPRIQALTDAWWHAGGNVLAVLIELYNWYLRYTSGEAAIVPTGLILSPSPFHGLERLELSLSLPRRSC